MFRVAAFLGGAAAGVAANAPGGTLAGLGADFASCAIPDWLHPLASDNNRPATTAQHNQPPKRRPICANLTRNTITKFTVIRKKDQRPAGNHHRLQPPIR
jgi:hypothetical protein